MLRALNSQTRRAIPILRESYDPRFSCLIQHYNFDNLNPRKCSNSIQNYKYIHTTSTLYKEPESKVDFYKENVQKLASSSQKETETQLASSIKPKPTLWKRVVDELKHYYNGFKLLFLETRICIRLLKQVVRGHTLTRRERKQLTTTAADLFRLVPFSIFIIVPFLEFTLPIFLKLFPNMLPSTFKDKSQEQEKLKKRLRAKLEVAKFLQDTLEETALTTNQKSVDHELTRNFAEFMKKIRSKGVQPSSEEILKYSSLFENELTLDNLTRQQLIALCQILDVSTYANIPPDEVLRFQLRTKMRTLEADDNLILKEGINNMTIKELQQACRERGMRALGLSEDRLRRQLEQWIDLHINKQIPTSLLILSRALYLTESILPEEAIKSTISTLPEFVEKETMLKIAESSGTKVDNKIKLEILKREEEELKKEREWIDKLDTSAEEIRKAEIADKAREASEVLVDKAKVEPEKLELFTPKEIQQIGQIIENISIPTEKQYKEDLDELKKDVNEYKQDLKEVETITEKEPVKLIETKSAKIISKRVERLISELDTLVTQLQQADTNEAQSSINQCSSAKNMVSIDEILAAIQKIQGVSDDIKQEKIRKVLLSLDRDRDGKIDDMSDVVKVFELISEENVKVTKDQLTIILNLLEKEKILELEEEQKKHQKQ